MNDLTDKPWYKNHCCGYCVFFTGEECNGNKHEGAERYSDSTACEEFEESAA